MKNIKLINFVIALTNAIAYNVYYLQKIFITMVDSELEVNINALKHIVHNIEKLENDKSAISEEINQIYTDAKSEGYDIKALKKLIRLRKIKDEERIKEEMILEHYKTILGMQ